MTAVWRKCTERALRDLYHESGLRWLPFQSPVRRVTRARRIWRSRKVQVFAATSVYDHVLLTFHKQAKRASDCVLAHDYQVVGRNDRRWSKEMAEAPR